MGRLDKKKIEDILSLTPMQEGMLFHYLKNPESDFYFEQLSLNISGEIDIEIFKRAWNFVVENNEMLRTLFRWQKIKNPTQVVLKYHHINTRYYDCTGPIKGQSNLREIKVEDKQVLDGGNGKLLVEIKIRDRQEKFNLRQVPFRVTLCKIAKDRYEMVISNHHILYDGWSNGIILKEFFEAYNRLSSGKEPVKQEKNKFREYIRWVRNRDRNRQEKFWEKYLAGVDTATEISVKRAGGREIFTTGNFNSKLGKKLRMKLEDFVKKNKITMSSLLYTAYGILLQKYNNNNDVIFGTTVSGRAAKIEDIENIVGLFINTLPLRVQSQSTEKTVNLLKKVNEAVQRREEYEATPLTDIKEYGCLGRTEEPFDSIVVVENYPLDIGLIRGKDPLTINSYSMFEMTHYDLTIALVLSDEIDVNFIYNEECFEQKVIERLSFHFSNVLEEITGNPDKEIGKIDILSPAEKKRLLFDFNHRETDFTKTKTIPQLFVEQVERTPDNTAIIGMGHESWGMGRNVGAKHSLPKQNSNASPLQSRQSAHLTYRELDEESDLLAHHLLGKGVVEHSVVGIMVGRSLEMIIGILGILKAGCGYVPLNTKAPATRNKYILDECCVRILLTTRKLSEILTNGKGRAKFGTYHYIDDITDIDDSIDESARLLIKAKIREHYHLRTAASIAYVIFTSGSTGRPKGVPISHANFCALMFWGYFFMGLGPEDRVVQNLSYYFDWSVWEIFIALTSGASLYMVSEDVMLNSETYVDFINKNKITALHITPTQFQTLTDTGQGFRSMKHLAIGAEKLALDLVLRAYALVNEDCRVYNMYGPTEATIMAAVLDIERGKEEFYKKLSGMPIGPPIANTDFLVLDKDLNVCPLNVPGELYIGGDSLTRGYLNNPELTNEGFVDDPFAKGSRLYKTGDLVRWLSDGTVEFVGRIDQQVKIRGFRIEPGEVENQLLLHEDIKKAFVMVRQYENGENYLCAYIAAESMEPGAGLSPSDLRELLAHTLPAYMIPAYFIAVEKMPLTPNGKIDIKSLPEPGIVERSREYTAPRDKVEEKLVKIWCDVLDINHSGESSPQVGIDDSFFESGGHSLKAARLLAYIHKEFDVEIPLGEVFNIPTIKGLSGYIKQKEKSKYRGLKPVEVKEYYPLSHGQKRLYILQQMENESRVYNMPGVLTAAGQIEKEKFDQAFFKLIERHESFRTSFTVIDEEPVQKIHSPEDVTFEIEYYSADHVGANLVFAREPENKAQAGVLESDRRGLIHQIQRDSEIKKAAASRAEIPSPGGVPLRDRTAEAPKGRGGLEDGAKRIAPHHSSFIIHHLVNEFVRPFDLSFAPLLRVGLIHIPACGHLQPQSQEGSTTDKFLLLVDMHHIISDGTSLAIFIGEFMSLFKGEELPFLTFQYKDYSEWLLACQEKKTLKKQESFWLKEFAEEIPVLNLPTDFPRPAIQSFAGKQIGFEINEENFTALKALVLQENVTLYMVLIAAFNIFLSKISGQEDIVIGTVTAGRRHADLEATMGMFVNTLALRNYPAGRKTIEEFIREVKDRALKAQENQEYQFEDLVEKLVVKRDASRNPLFDVMLVMQNVDISQVEVAGLKLSPYDYSSRISKFDMTFICVELERSLHFTIEYSSKLFKKETIKRLANYYKTIISFVVNEPGRKISEIRILPEEDRKQILEGFNHGAEAYPLKTVVALFEEQVAKIPGNIAYFENRDYITYEVLNKRADVLAKIIKEL